MDAKKIIIKEIIKNRIENPDDLAYIKRMAARQCKKNCPTNIELLKLFREMIKNGTANDNAEILNLLKTRPMRSLSGIVNVSVLTKPYPCPGKCIYCPAQKGAPKSYLNNEPAVMRAILNKYDPEKQVLTRLTALKDTGHPTDKIELRIIGGTWSFYPKKYQTWFIKKCFDACNGKNSKDLKSAQMLNETAKKRIIGLSIETRPDFINLTEIKKLRNFGVTMVELGVQSIYDDILKKNRRGHGKKETILATELLKNAGFKVLYQMMPNLLGSSRKKDKEMFKELFLRPGFQPDLLKIYPCAIVKEAPLYKLWKKKKYHPYKELSNLIKSIKKDIPYYVRIQRITRDIPSQTILTGPAKISNLRQLIENDFKKDGLKCRCIRCREVKGNYDKKEKLYLFRENYRASNGKEIFLSFENKERSRLFSLLRLRIPDNRINVQISCLKNSAIIREVHTFGQLQSIKSGGHTNPSPQHKGFGKKLIKEAEKITKKEFRLAKVAVISGIGAKKYYQKLGYKPEETYMVKKI